MTTTGRYTADRHVPRLVVRAGLHHVDPAPGRIDANADPGELVVPEYAVHAVAREAIHDTLGERSVLAFGRGVAPRQKGALGRVVIGGDLKASRSRRQTESDRLKTEAHRSASGA